MPKGIRPPLPTAPAAGTAIRVYVHRNTPGQAELARRLGVQPDILNRILRGTGRYPAERLTGVLIARIAATFDVPRAVEAEWLALFDSTQDSIAS
jgi:transcriptional regulator with XRE-family HTH domain